MGAGVRLDVVADAEGEGQVGADLPVIFGEAVEDFEPEVVLALGVRGGVDLIDGLHEAVVAEAGVGVGVSGLTAEAVGGPVLKLLGGGAAVAVDAAALEEIDHDLVDEVDVAAELEGVVAVGGGEDVRDLGAVLVGLGDAR